MKNYCKKTCIKDFLINFGIKIVIVFEPELISL